MVWLLKTVLLVAWSASVVVADNILSCGPSQKCPSSAPCCSQYGQCGVGAYCLGGCDPVSSFSLNSCAPAPVCQSKTYTWDNLDNVQPNTKYLGNVTAADWVSSGQPLISGGSLILTMAPKTVGTLLAYNHYVWYGKVSAKLKTSRGQGVVTAFILLSDVKDEIDWEFVGTELTTAQTNYYFQGILDYTHGANASTTDTFNDWHTYEIDWQPDSITWSIDGQSVRTLNRSSTWNATSNQYDYPQTPSRLQLSLWPGGLSTNGEGTIAWAGGVIDWNSIDIQQHGYDYATFGDVSIQCYDPPPGANIQGNTSYIYTNPAGTNDTIEITDKPTVLGSFQATGTNMTAGTSSASSSASPTTDSVPGQNGGSGAEANAAASSGSSAAGSAPSSSTTSFSQGGSSTTKNSAPSQSERVLKSSFAVLVAVVVLVAM